MKLKDTEATYRVASATAQLIGDVVGSSALGFQIVSSILLPDESPTEKNIQLRLREALSGGSLQVKGLGPKGIKRLQSALALGRALHVDMPDVGTVVSDSAIAARAFHEIAWEPVEKFAVLAMDIKHRVISMRVISSGSATETSAHPREIFRWIIQVGGTRCIVAHNHPSGSLEPSPEDINLTQQLLEAGRFLGIPVLEHLIVSGGEYASIRQVTSLWAEFD